MALKRFMLRRVAHCCGGQVQRVVGWALDHYS